jgi:hypothetical protein
MPPYHRAGIELSTVEVRFDKLSVTADVFTTSSRALPSLPNFFLNAAQVTGRIWSDTFTLCSCKREDVHRVSQWLCAVANTHIYEVDMYMRNRHHSRCAA